MTPQEVLAQFRSDMSDEADPPLWSDDDAWSYYKQSYDTMVKRIGGIADVTVDPADAAAIAGTRLPDLATTASEPYTAFSPYILRIRSGRLLTAKRDIPFLQEGDLNTVMVRDYGWTRGMTLDDTDEGDVTHGVLGVRENYVRWIRVPASADTVRLNVLRLPYPRPTGWEDGLSIELPEDLHVHLVTGMRALAYLKQDAETYDRTQAERMATRFERACHDAYNDVQRRRYRRRSMAYGGL